MEGCELSNNASKKDSIENGGALMKAGRVLATDSQFRDTEVSETARCCH